MRNGFPDVVLLAGGRTVRYKSVRVTTMMSTSEATTALPSAGTGWERAQPGTVSVWRVRLDSPSLRAAPLEAVLSVDERARAARLHFEHSRRTFIVTRAVLRLILSRQMGTEPDAVRFVYSAEGKPSLVAAGCRLRFNVSHSGDVALVAVTIGVEVGVDVERVRPVPDALSIARRFYTAREATLVGQQTEGERDRVFLSIWTRKEACLKAVGRGLLIDPAVWDVTSPPAARFIRDRTTGPHDIPERVWFRDVCLGAEYTATVAAAAETWSFVVRDLESPGA